MVFIPHATKTLKVRASVEIDMFKSIAEVERSSGVKRNPSGPFPSKGGRCGPSYSVPGIYNVTFMSFFGGIVSIIGQRFLCFFFFSLERRLRSVVYLAKSVK